MIEPDSCDTTRAKAFPFPNTFKASAQEVRGAKYVDLTDYYCDDKTCPSVIGGVNVYRDNSHLTTTYTKTMAPYVLRELRKVGALS